jgi:hypothetical protein
MNLISFFNYLFDNNDDEIAEAVKVLKENFSNKDTIKEKLLKDHKFIEATDLYLKEIELIVHGNIDYNKDRHNIQNLIKKFEDFELSLSKKFTSKELIISSHKSLMTGHTYPSWIPIWLSEIEEAKEIQRLITEIRERKTKVDERIKELGKKF